MDPLDFDGEDGEWLVCAVCGYPLEHGDTEGWHHVESVDHPAVPVRPTEIQFASRCDFCHATPVVSVLMAASFDTPSIRSVGNWHACRTCGRLVRRNAWIELVNYVRNHGPLVLQQVEREFIEVIYEDLRKNLVGVMPYEQWRARVTSPNQP